MSRDSSWTIEQGSGSLGPSISIDTDGFAKILDRYQSGARSIQTSFQALYRQIQDSPQGTNSLMTEKMITNVEQRLAQLDADRQELNAQLRRFASPSEASSFLAQDKTPTRVARPRPSFSTISESDIPHNALIEQLKAENTQLRNQLSAQVDLARRLRRGLSTVVGFVARRCASLGSSLNSRVQTLSDRLEHLTNNITSLAGLPRPQKRRPKKLSRPSAEQKAAISALFNSFHSELFKARHMCREAIQKQLRSPGKRSSGSSDAIFASPVKGRRNVTYGGHSPVMELGHVTDKTAPLLANACDQLAGSILAQFSDGEVWPPAVELVQTPLDFGKQLERICLLNETGIRRLRAEIDGVNAKLAAVQVTVSPEVARMVNQILAVIGSLSDEMRMQYQELLARLQ
jgi:hypothetical protein